jgi:hypothetical protein
VRAHVFARMPSSARGPRRRLFGRAVLPSPEVGNRSSVPPPIPSAPPMKRAAAATEICPLEGLVPEGPRSHHSRVALRPEPVGQLFTRVRPLREWVASVKPDRDQLRRLRLLGRRIAATLAAVLVALWRVAAQAVGELRRRCAGRYRFQTFRTDDLAGLDRLQQELDELRVELATKGGPRPVAVLDAGRLVGIVLPDRPRP